MTGHDCSSKRSFMKWNWKTSLCQEFYLYLLYSFCLTKNNWAAGHGLVFASWSKNGRSLTSMTPTAGRKVKNLINGKTLTFLFIKLYQELDGCQESCDWVVRSRNSRRCRPKVCSSRRRSKHRSSFCRRTSCQKFNLKFTQTLNFKRVCYCKKCLTINESLNWQRNRCSFFCLSLPIKRVKNFNLAFFLLVHENSLIFSQSPRA